MLILLPFAVIIYTDKDDLEEKGFILVNDSDYSPSPQEITITRP